jgi:23S rRNA (guanine745-N1)-methyltransferase
MSLVCDARHTFDISAKGQVNLLRAFGSSHGDNADMVAARRRFLSLGAYQPMRTAVAEALSEYLPTGGILLDSGCGEGYYTEEFAKNPALSVYGIDISPKAAAFCAKKNRCQGVAVASAYDLPIPDGACDAITNIFSPFCREEFHRTLKSGGIVIDVIPAERHLYELKAAIYDTPYENEENDLILEGFERIDRASVRYEAEIVGNDRIRALFMMTPYYFRTSREDAEKLSGIDTLKTEVETDFFVFRKK